MERKHVRETMGNRNGAGRKGTESESQRKREGGRGNLGEEGEEQIGEIASESHLNYVSDTILLAL